jgi:hypothetical protein
MNQPYNQNFNQNSQFQPVPSFYGDINFEGNPSRGFLNFLEIGLVVLVLIALVAAIFVGFFGQTERLRDQNRKQEIEQIVWALNMFYENSSLVPSERRYPVAACSGQLNEVDYEFTLKQYLTGQKEEFDSHPYIKGLNKDTDFFRDKWGIYTDRLDKRQIPIRNCPNIFSNIQDWNGFVYPDGSKSCQFKPSNPKYRKCYLYTSSINGISYEVAYYSEAQQAFVIYSRFRDGSVEIKTEKV